MKTALVLMFLTASMALFMGLNANGAGCPVDDEESGPPFMVFYP